VIAAGNAGRDGPFSASNGASGKNVLTVASGEPGVFPAQAFTADFNMTEHRSHTYQVLAIFRTPFLVGLSGRSV